MSKFGKLPSKTYNIYHFNFTKLLEYGKRDKENLILEVNKEYSKLSYKVVNNNALYEGYDKKGNCQLFDQTLKILNVEDKEDIFEHIYVIIDFKDYINSKNGKKEFVKTLRQFENGIKLYIKDKEIHIVDFLKSNTMSKACCVLYINKEFADNTNIINRATFGLDKKQYILSKWYAYSGLSLSDATILHNIKFKADELVVIPDDEKERNVECITAISVDLLQELIDIYRKRISDIKGTTPYKEKLNYKKALEVVAKDNTKYDDFKIFASNFSKMQKVYEKLMCYRNSKDYERLSETIDSQYSEYIKKIVYTLNKAVEIIDSDDTFDIVYEKLGVLIKEVNNPEHHEVYWENFHVVNFPITINKFDGEGLITLDLARQINNELNQFNEKKLPYGYTFQIRLPFIKGIVNSCNIKEFCKEKGITKIYGLSYDENKYKEYDISNVKMILTESQFKCAKLLKNCGMSIDKFMELLNEYDYSLGINHLEYSHDSKVDLNYQVCSTLPFNQQELDYLIEFNDRQYKEETSSEKLIAACIERYKSDLENEMVNRPEYYDFYMSTQRYKDFRRTTIESLKSKYLSLKFKQNGERRFLCSDCLELLYHAFYHQSINAFKDYMNLSEIYAPKNKLVANEKCFILRNPHYSRNEIGIMKNSTQDGSERKKYFGHLSGVIMFNPLSLLADRLGGADFDGDSVIIVNAMFARKAIRKLEIKEKGNSLIYPVVNIPGLDSQPVEFNYVNKVHSLYNTFNSRVGLISNAALSESFSVYKEDFNKHDRIALYTIINGLEIDSAKKGIKPMLIKSVKPKLAKEFLRIKDEELKRNKGLSKYSIKFIADNANEHSIYYLMHKSLSYEPSKENVSRKSITRGYKYDIN